MSVVAPKQMQDAANLKLCCPVSNPLIVHEQREVDARFFAEETCVAEIAQTYSRELSSRASEFALMIAQLRDVLPAEDSSVMTKKNRNSGTPLP
jgi:hypothetical protein